MHKFFSISAFVLVSLTASAQAGEKCGQAAFAAVVNEASAQLTAMNDENRTTFHAKLQSLKARQNWNDADYVANARTFVQDDRIAAFDANGKALLSRVELIGQPEQVTVTASIATPLGALDREAARRCAMLEDLRGLMSEVVSNTRAKWHYMHTKLDTASETILQAKVQ